MNPELLAAIGLGIVAVVFLVMWITTGLRLDASQSWLIHWKAMFESADRTSDTYRDSKYALENEISTLKKTIAQLEQANQDQASRLNEVMAAATGIEYADGRAAEKAALQSAKKSIDAAMAVVDELS